MKKSVGLKIGHSVRNQTDELKAHSGSLYRQPPLRVEFSE